MKCRGDGKPSVIIPCIDAMGCKNVHWCPEASFNYNLWVVQTNHLPQMGATKLRLRHARSFFLYRPFPLMPPAGAGLRAATDPNLDGVSTLYLLLTSSCPKLVPRPSFRLLSCKVLHHGADEQSLDRYAVQRRVFVWDGWISRLFLWPSERHSSSGVKVCSQIL